MAKSEAETERASRVVSAMTSDSYRVRGKLTLLFAKKQTERESEATLETYERAFISVISTTQSSGTLPIDEAEILARIRRRLHSGVAPVETARILSLHIVGVMTPSGTFMAPNSIVPAISVAPLKPVSTFRTRTVAVPTAPSTPSFRALPATRWMPVTRDLDASSSTDQIAGAHAPVLQETMARLSMAMLAAADASGFARFDAFSSGVPNAALAPLRRETAAAVAYMMLTALEAARVPSGTAIDVVQRSGQHVLPGQGLPVADLSRYLGTKAAANELATASASLLPSSSESLALAVLSPLVRHVQNDFIELAAEIQRVVHL